MDMNIDIKDVIAKLKNGKKKDARGGSAVTQFFEKNPKMKIIIPAVIVVISIAVAIAIVISGFTADTQLAPEVSAGSGAAVEVLPQLERTTAPIAEGVDPFAEDVIANASLTGIVYNSAGYRTAIVSTEYASYVLQAGDYVSTSSWLVEEITDNSITFSLDGKSRTIEMK